MERVWYVFLGGDPFDVNRYYRIPRGPDFLCGDKVCAINAPDSGQDQPLGPLSKNLQKYIRDGMIRGMYQPESPVDAKPYVYLRD